jgi:hypothetical protein
VRIVPSHYPEIQLLRLSEAEYPLDRLGRRVGSEVARLAPPELQTLYQTVTAPQVMMA